MSNYELSLNDYWRIIHKRMWIIIVTTILLFSAVAIYTMAQTPLYKATATLKIEPEIQVDKFTQIKQSFLGQQTDMRMINSTVSIEMLAREMKLLNDTDTEEKKAEIIKTLQGKIFAEQLQKTDLINISAFASNPKDASQLANTMAEVFIKQGFIERNHRIKQLSGYVENQMLEVKANLEATENEKKRLLERGKTGNAAQYLTTRMFDLERQKTEMLEKYTEAHPSVKDISLQIIEVENEIAKLPAEDLAFARVSRDNKINEELYTLLSKKFKEIQISEAANEQWATVITPAQAPSRPVKPNLIVNLAVGLFMGLFLGFILALLIQNVDTSIGSIEDMEAYLGLPVLAIVPHIRSEGLFIQAGHKGKSYELRGKLSMFHSDQSPATESFNSLKTNVKFAVENLKKKGTKFLAFTSSGGGEGKTLVASNYAIACARAGKRTLLVELDLRRPSIDKVFGLSLVPGFSECVIGSAKLDDVIRGTVDFLVGEPAIEKTAYPQWIENFKVLTSGGISQNPSGLFSSDGFSKIISELSGKFDYVIFDCSPVLLFSDTLMISEYLTGAVIVYKSGQTSREALKRAKDQLTGANIKVLGVVFNDLTASDVTPGYSTLNYKYYSKKDA